METSLRLILLSVGIMILIGIIWDIVRGKQKKNKSLLAASSKQSMQDYLSEVKKTEDRTEDKLEVPEPDQKLIHENISFDEPHYETLEVPDVLTERLITEPRIENSRFDHPNKSEKTERRIENKRLENRNDKNAQIPDLNGEIIVLNVFAKQPGVFFGKKLLEAFDANRLYFGHMNIFHRHDNLDGSGNILFSVASAVEPGAFELEKIASFITPGISLFFALNRPNQAITAFESMLRTAKQLQSRLDGELRDDQRRILSIQRIDAYRDKVRRFEMNQRSIKAL